MHYIFDLFKTLVKVDLDEFYVVMAGSFGLNKQQYKERLRVFISTTNFESKEEALSAMLYHLDYEMTKSQKSKFINEMGHWSRNAQLYEGAFEVLEELKNRGAKIGIVSNNNIFIEDVVKLTGLSKYIDVVCMSHKTGFLKPFEIAYNDCLEKLDLKPEQVTMVGDQLEKDVLVPEKFGMCGVLFDPDNKNPSYHNRIGSLSELL
jgi:HAD superfamily hydrolase (TIGR01662 family)